MPEGTNEIPEFDPEIGPVESAKIEIDPEAQERAERAMQRAQNEDISKPIENDDRLERKNKIFGGIAKAAVPIAVIGGGAVLAPEVVSHITEVKIDDGAYLKSLKEKTPDVYQSVIQNRTIEAVGEENWENMTAEEKGQAIGEMAKKTEEAIKEYEQGPSSTMDSDGNAEVRLEDGTTFRTDYSN